MKKKWDIILASIIAVGMAAFAFSDMSTVRSHYSTVQVRDSQASAATQATIVAAPNSNRRIVIDDIQFKTNAACSVYISNAAATTYYWGPWTFVGVGSYQCSDSRIVLPQGVALILTCTGTSTWAYQLEYHVE